MAFFRFTRDKRGYEHFSLVESTTNRRGKVRQRVLYWFRSPPDVRVGREPFDEGVRRALEAQNPDVTFDWRSILETRIPSADADKWRERRRAERAAKQALAAESDDEPEIEGAVMADAAERAPVDSTRVEAPPGGATSAPVNRDAARRKRRRPRGRRATAPGEPEQARTAVDTGDAAEPAEPTEE